MKEKHPCTPNSKINDSIVKKKHFQPQVILFPPLIYLLLQLNHEIIDIYSICQHIFSILLLKFYHALGNYSVAMVTSGIENDSAALTAYELAPAADSVANHHQMAPPAVGRPPLIQSAKSCSQTISILPDFQRVVKGGVVCYSNREIGMSQSFPEEFLSHFRTAGCGIQVFRTTRFRREFRKELGWFGLFK